MYIGKMIFRIDYNVMKEVEMEVGKVNKKYCIFFEGRLNIVKASKS